MQVPSDILSEIAVYYSKNIRDVLRFQQVNHTFKTALEKSHLSIRIDNLRLNTLKWQQFVTWCINNIRLTSRLSFFECNINNTSIVALISKLPYVRSCGIEKCFSLDGHSFVDAISTGVEHQTNQLEHLCLSDISCPFLQGLIRPASSFKNLLYLGLNNSLSLSVGLSRGTFPENSDCTFIQKLAQSVCTEYGSLPSLQCLMLGGSIVSYSSAFPPTDPVVIQQTNSISNQPENDPNNSEGSQFDELDDQASHSISKLMKANGTLKLLETTFIPQCIVIELLALFDHALSESSHVIDLTKTSIQELDQIFFKSKNNQFHKNQSKAQTGSNSPPLALPTTSFPSHVLTSATESRDGAGFTPLHQVSYQGDDTRMEWLITKGCARVSIRDSRGATPLYHASQMGFAKCCKLLLDAGANPLSEKNHRSEGPIYVAALRGHSDILHDMLENSHVKNYACVKESIKGVSVKPVSPTSVLKASSSSSSLSPPQIKPSKGLNPAAKEWSPCLSPHHHLLNINRSHQKIFGSGVSGGGGGGGGGYQRSSNYDRKKKGQTNCALSITSQTSDFDGFSPLHCAVLRRSLSTLQVLLSHGFDVEARNKYFQTPLHLSALHHHHHHSRSDSKSRKEFSKLAELLLQYGANVNAKDDQGKTPLDYCGDVKQQSSGKGANRMRKPTPQDTKTVLDDDSSSTIIDETAQEEVLGGGIEALLRSFGGEMSTHKMAKIKKGKESSKRRKEKTTSS